MNATLAAGAGRGGDHGPHGRVDGDVADGSRAVGDRGAPDRECAPGAWRRPRPAPQAPTGRGVRQRGIGQVPELTLRGAAGRTAMSSARRNGCSTAAKHERPRLALVVVHRRRGRPRAAGTASSAPTTCTRRVRSTTTDGGVIHESLREALVDCAARRGQARSAGQSRRPCACTRPQPVDRVGVRRADDAARPSRGRCRSSSGILMFMGIIDRRAGADDVDRRGEVEPRRRGAAGERVAVRADGGQAARAARRRADHDRRLRRPRVPGALPVRDVRPGGSAARRLPDRVLHPAATWCSAR